MLKLFSICALLCVAFAETREEEEIRIAKYIFDKCKHNEPDWKDGEDYVSPYRLLEKKVLGRYTYEPLVMEAFWSRVEEHCSNEHMRLSYDEWENKVKSFGEDTFMKEACPRYLWWANILFVVAMAIYFCVDTYNLFHKEIDWERRLYYVAMLGFVIMASIVLYEEVEKIVHTLQYHRKVYSALKWFANSQQ